MVTKDEDKKAQEGAAPSGDELGSDLLRREDQLQLRSEDELAVEQDAQPADLGTQKYVHAAFFGAGMLLAYLSGKLLALAWNLLAEWPMAARAVPQLLLYGEEERGSIMLSVGALIGLIAVIQAYRKPHVRQWATDVATELSKVTWPEKSMVTNGTMVVVVTSVVAAVYIALLDRLWGFLTTLVYGA